MLEHTLSQLRQLKLLGMADALQLQSEQPGNYDALSFAERIALMADAEHTERENRKHARLLKSAQLKIAANAQGIDYTHTRGLDKSTMANLLSCEWVDKYRNLLLTGPCGSGKTYLACALAHTAINKSYSAKYYRLSRLLTQLQQAKADGSYQKLLNQLSKIKLLILDDWGLELLQSAHRNDLMEIMDDRHGTSSTIVISQLPTDEWYQSIGDNTLADAILDRLMHNAHRINLRGESMRKVQSELT